MMNTAADVLTYAEQHGIALLAEGQQLILEAEKGTVPLELVEKARQHKPGLLLITIIRQACNGLDIKPDQFLALINQDDKAAILGGELPVVPTLRAYAKSFAEGIQSGRIKFHPTSGALLKHL